MTRESNRINCHPPAALKAPANDIATAVPSRLSDYANLPPPPPPAPLCKHTPCKQNPV
ncbi:hypothetical protein [Geminisphaera colitermitum]|uniref:hypothetical protein n=1 Tax=Geminisphaera colitermitum TaxID=1148786 RepID=UPI0002DB441F|nr:hypothetical protein [Geminisphaera colitermitum]